MLYNQNNPDKVKKELDDILYSKSAKGSVSNKSEKIGRDKEVIYDDTELLNYIKWYFSISESL